MLEQKLSQIGGAAERGQAARRRLQASQQAGWGTHAEAWSDEDVRAARMKPPIEPTSAVRNVKLTFRTRRMPVAIWLHGLGCVCRNAPSPGDVLHKSDTRSPTIRNINLISIPTYSDVPSGASVFHLRRAELRSIASMEIAPIQS
jgi:hypothetical protein